MSLRYRLFVWVGIVFAAAFIVSFFWEEHVTRQSLEQTYQELLGQLEKLNEKKTRAIEDYLSDSLYKVQAEVDAVLQGVAKYQLVRKGFEPSLENLKEANWLDSASLMITNRWIDFIQSTNENSLMSEIIIDDNRLSDTFHFSGGESFHLVAARDPVKPSEWQGPYVGVTLDIGSLHEVGDEETGADELYYVFFRPETILNFKVDADAGKTLGLSINLLEPFLKWVEVPTKEFYLGKLVEQILAAQKYLKANPGALAVDENWKRGIEEKEKTFKKKSCFTKDRPVLGRQVDVYIDEYVDHYNKVGLIWGLSTLTHSSLFGKDPLSPQAPVGMGMFNQKDFCGKALLAESVFYNQPKYPVGKKGEKINQFDIITPDDMHRVFFGGTLKLEAWEGDQTRTGYLTIGNRGVGILRSLSRSTHKTALFVSSNKVISGFDPEGNWLRDPSWYQIPVQKLIGQPSGCITIGGTEYFFLHIAVHKDVDLHFFMFTPKAEEFAFIDAMNKSAEEIVEKISLQMRLAAIGGLLFVLVLLSNISKRITRPISHLAKVTETVAEGKLDDIEIPEETESKRHDEVATLYHSFFEMVKGLREKERVRGVLNKVVSKEIAEETLKGNVQLGGEEKRVTVLFADIRGFTKITEQMDPKEVIQLINTCMTKVSETVDKYGGVIDKYVGDEVMALFGAPIEKEGSVLSAIKSAIDMIEALKGWNEERKKEELPKIEMGIGIHTGNVVAGNMGAENRLNYTVLGANVNLASRICSKAAPMQILISEATLEEVKAHIDCESLESIELKGFTKPVALYVVKGCV